MNLQLHRASPIVSTGLVVVAALAVAACSSTGATPPPAIGTEAVSATLSEWKVDLAVSSAPAGKVVFSIANQGAIAHEFLMMRTDMMAGSLPMKDNMIDVGAMGGAMGSGMDMPGTSPAGDMEHPAGTVGVVEEIAPGATAQLTLDDLPAGHYVIACDLPTHYEQGMYTDFTVE